MAAVVARRVRATQPLQNLQIDWENPITEGLVAVFVFGPDGAQGWDESGRTFVPYLTTGSVVTGVPVNMTEGTGARVISTGVPYLIQSVVQTSIKSGVYSLFAAGTASGSGTYSAIDDDDGTTRRLQFRLNAGRAELIPFSSGGNGDAIAPAALSASDLANGFTMGAIVNGTANAVFQKGVKTTGTALSSAALAPNSSIAVGARKTGVQQWTTGGLQIIAIWNRAHADSEQTSMADNRWQLFKPQPARRLWLAWSATSGTTTNVNPGAGTLALSGYAPTVAQSANQGVTPGAGALTLTGYAPSVTQSVTTNVAPAAGSLTLAGFAPTVTRTANVNVAPAAGSLTLTGYAPTVTRTTSQAVQPGVGGLTLTGYAPLITQGIDNAPRVNVATIMRITTTNRMASLGAAASVVAPIRSTGPNIAAIMRAGVVNCTADIGPATINRTVSFP
jgi:hypothetical protein